MVWVAGLIEGLHRERIGSLRDHAKQGRERIGLPPELRDRVCDVWIWQLREPFGESFACRGDRQQVLPTDPHGHRAWHGGRRTGRVPYPVLLPAYRPCLWSAHHR
ncbi:MAG: hypothetical protein AAGB51_06175 [Planctomycetota bacterium]